MVVVAAALAVLSVLLADPVPRLLGRARWPHRDPIAGLLLWQAIGLAAGLSLCGCFFVIGLHRLGESLPEALIAVINNLVRGDPLRMISVIDGVSIGIGVALALRLLWGLARSLFRVLRVRRAHRDALNILATPWPDDPGVLMLDHPMAVAYCLPGNKSRLVISSGATERLTRAELGAVIVHEKAHLASRHDLVVLPFVAWGVALPFVVGVRRAQASVALLVEMMADDAVIKAGLGVALEGALRTMRPAFTAGLGGVEYEVASEVRAVRVAAASQRRRRYRWLAILASFALLAMPTATLIGPAFF